MQVLQADVALAELRVVALTDRCSILPIFSVVAVPGEYSFGLLDLLRVEFTLDLRVDLSKQTSSVHVPLQQVLIL